MMTSNRARRLLSLVGLLVVVGAGVLYGQRDGGDTNPFAPRVDPFTAIAQKLDQLLAVVAPTGNVTLFTGQLHATQTVSCQVTNVRSVTPLVVTIRLLYPDGTEVVPATTTPPIVMGESERVWESRHGHLRCEFSFQGSATDVRASISVERVILGDFGSHSTAALHAY